MNNISWWLYLAEVIPNFGTGLAILAFIGAAIGTITSAILTFEPSLSEEDKERKLCYKILTASVVGILLSMLFPSKETIYLILGSEVGETVVSSPEGKEIINDIREVINLQIENLKPKVK